MPVLETIGLVSALLDSAAAIFDLRSHISKGDPGRKVEVANLLAEISRAIEHASAELKLGNYPHGACRELELHAEELGRLIIDDVGETKANQLALQLREATVLERLHAELPTLSSEERVRCLAVMDSAAGTFKATAAHVRAS